MWRCGARVWRCGTGVWRCGTAVWRCGAGQRIFRALEGASGLERSHHLHESVLQRAASAPVEEVLGHRDVTTMIDTHVLRHGARGVRSPLDVT